MREDEFRLTPDLESFKNQLAQLTPAGVDGLRDCLMYEAGRASVSRKLHVWRGAVAALAASLAASLIVPHMNPVDRQTWNELPVRAVDVRENAEITACPAVPAAGLGYLHVSRRVFDEGLNALPTDSPRTPAPFIRMLDRGWAGES